ncbi:hypothetical protein EDD16DRAFT_1660245 [Pisolithus croceorrhizus]|nr:hypothetical protein EDD16DRAFT_1660245 [Pisolithus croceorrhizus]
MHSWHSTCLVHVSYAVLLPDNQLRRSDEFGVHCRFPLTRRGRSFSASALVNSLVIIVAQLFFAHKIYCLCRRAVKWSVTVPIIPLVLAQFGRLF